MLNTVPSEPLPIKASESTCEQVGTSIKSLQERLVYTSPSKDMAVEDAANEGCDI